jgi:hypothetical protein
VQKTSASIQKQNAAASIPLLEYAENFWQPDGEYAGQKALVDKEPLSTYYLLREYALFHAFYFCYTKNKQKLVTRRKITCG